jgi:NADH dehydrogenase
MSRKVQQQLEKNNINVLLQTRINEVTAKSMITIDNRTLDADVQFWAAGIKAPDWLNGIGGLAYNRINQIEVNMDLTTTVDECIFALGDCAAIPQPDGGFVPPKAQAANRAAIHLAKNLIKLIETQKPLMPFIYHDGGMVLSIGHKDAIGEIRDGKLIIKGKIVRDLYDSIFLLHQRKVIGIYRVSRKIMTKKVKKYLKSEEF